MVFTQHDRPNGAEKGTCMNAKDLCEAIRERLQFTEFAEALNSVDYFKESVNASETDPVYGIDEVRIEYGPSEGVYANFYGSVGEDDTANVLTLKALDSSAAGFNTLCKLSGVIVAFSEKILIYEKNVQLVKTLLSDAVNGIFLKLQGRMGIRSGDISPEDSLIFEDRKSDLLGTIMDVLSKQAS